MQCLHCVWITRIIWQRLQLTRRAVERFDKLSNRNVAWSDRVTVAIVVQPRNENFLTEIHDNYKVIGSVYETFSTVTQLHAMYFCVYLLAEITIYSFQIFYTTTDANRRDGTLFAIITRFDDIMLLAMCECITREFQRLQSLIHGLYYKSGLRNVRDCTRRTVYRYGHVEKKFDSAFFLFWC